MKDAQVAKTQTEETKAANAKAAQAAQDKANQLVSDAISKATDSRTIVTNAGTIVTTIEEAQK